MGRIVIDRGDRSGQYTPAEMQAVDAVVTAAAQWMVPVELILSDASHDSIDVAVGLGASGIIIQPQSIQEAKTRIREIDTASCRTLVLAGPREDMV
jgi:phosphoenolpyruvate-protein kinase (PTS system EI component)